MSNKRILKELSQLRKTPPSQSNHQVLRLEPVGEDIFEWQAVFAKQTTSDSPYYYNGQWTLDIRIPHQYPQLPPKVHFNKDTPILHPNVNFETGEICLDILKPESWSPAWTLEYVVVAIAMLVDDPEPDSPLNLDLANLFRYDTEAFESMVQYTIWKYNTFFEDNGQRLHDDSGVKVTEGVDSEDVAIARVARDASEAMHELQTEAESVVDDVKNISLENKQEDLFASKIASSANDRAPDNTVRDSHDAAVAQIDKQVEALEEQKRALGVTSPVPAPDLDVIHEVGKQVTEQFLAKMDEMNSNSSPHSLVDMSQKDAEDIDRVRLQVTSNVSKQVSELCLRSVSPEAHDTTKAPESDEFLRSKEQFLKQVDEQIRARTASGHSTPLVESDRELQVTQGLSTSGKRLPFSKIKRTMSLKKSKRTQFKKQ